MKAWFLSLSQRERILLQSAAAVMIVFLSYIIIWQPLSDNYEKNKKNVLTATETLEWMKKASRDIKILRGNHSVNTTIRSGKQFVLGVVDRTVRKSGLNSTMKRVQPEGESGVRVWFEQAPFDELIKWLAVIESEQGLIVNEINIERSDSPGLVNVRVYLES
ncbi:MAG: type II secretion system protein M [Gammaproteobacteria bacterium]|nr:type II secretion system protein M [Gammaproteobacteria bacterium]